MAFFLFGNKKQYTALLLLFFGLLFSIIVGFRSAEVGIDTQSYYDVFEQIQGNNVASWYTKKLGSFFIYLNSFSASLGFDATFVTFFYAFFTIFFIFLTLYQQSDNITISLALFLSGLGIFFFMHNVMRQALAIAIIFYSIRFLCDKKQIKFYLVCTVAFFVHASSVFFLPFYYLGRLTPNPLTLIIVWIGTLPFIYNTSLIIGVLELFSFLIPTQYIGYLSEGDAYSKGGVSAFGLLVLLKQFIFFLLLFAYKKDFNVEYRRIVYMLTMYSVLIGNLVLGLGLVGRFNEYLAIFMLLGLPMSICTLVKAKQQPLAFGLIYILILIIYVRTLIGDGNGLFISV